MGSSRHTMLSVLFAAALLTHSVAAFSSPFGSSSSASEPGLPSCLSDGCSEQLGSCLSNVACAKVLGFAGSPVDGKLISPLDLTSLESDAAPGGGGAWMDLKRCYDFACNTDDQRRMCSVETPGMAMHLPGTGACAVAPCHLTNDQPRTSSAAECSKRCELHVLPLFNESCVGWSWGSRPGSMHYEECYLMQREGPGTADRRFDSGACKGGPSKTEEMLAAERHLCQHIMESANNLRVYLQVEKQLSLTEEKFKDLYTYMDIMHMCPDELDGRFAQAVNHFSPPPPKKDTLYESLKIYAMGCYDFFIKNYAVLSVVATVLSPVLLPFMCTWIGMLFLWMPMLEKMLAPVLPKVLAAPLEEHINRAHGQSGAAAAEAESAATESPGLSTGAKEGIRHRAPNSSGGNDY